MPVGRDIPKRPGSAIHEPPLNVLISHLPRHETVQLNPRIILVSDVPGLTPAKAATNERSLKVSVVILEPPRTHRFDVSVHVARVVVVIAVVYTITLIATSSSCVTPWWSFCSQRSGYIGLLASTSIPLPLSQQIANKIVNRKTHLWILRGKEQSYRAS